MAFLLRPQIILLSALIAAPSYAAYECRRLTKLYPRRKPEHFSAVLIPSRPCTQHVPRSNAVLFSARLHGDVLYAARRRYLKEHAGEIWGDSGGGGGVGGGGAGGSENKPRSAFDYRDDIVSLNELWARTWLGGKSIAREASWYGFIFDRRKKDTPREQSYEVSASASWSVEYSSTSGASTTSSASWVTTSPPGSTPNTANTIPFHPNQSILRGIFTVVRPPTENDGMLMQWNVPHRHMVRWAKTERFMGMWMPWRLMSGGKQLLDVVPIWENGGLWFDVRYSCAQFYEDDMSEDPPPLSSPDRQRNRKKETGGGSGSGNLFERIRHPGASISGVDRRKEMPRWATWCHEMYARKLLDDAVKKLVKDARADWGDGSRKRALRIEDVGGIVGTRIVEDEGGIMRNGED